MTRRNEVQAQRRRADEEILRLFLRPMWCIEGDHGYSELQRGMTEFLGRRDLFQDLTTLHEDPKS